MTTTTLTPGADFLLGFIIETETAKTGVPAYNTLYGHNEKKLAKPLTGMTLDEWIKAGPSWTKRFKSSAAGGPQFMNATLKGLKDEMGLTGKERMVPDLQDAMGYRLLLRRGWLSFVAGTITRAEFGKRLAMEWASFPVLAACKGAHQKLKRGQSYYAGDALNKSLVDPRTVEKILDQALDMEKRAAAKPKPAPVPQPKPEAEPAAPTPIVVEKPVVVDPEKLDKPLTTSKTFWTWLGTGLVSLLTVAKESGLFDLDWRVQIALLLLVVVAAVYGIKGRNDLRKGMLELKANPPAPVAHIAVPQFVTIEGAGGGAGGTYRGTARASYPKDGG